jgi:tetratricopeptide (TPR) repeat protein
VACSTTLTGAVNIFVSHSGDAQAEAASLEGALEAAGHETLHAHDGASAAEWKDDLERRIKDADAYVVLVDPTAQRSQLLDWEWSTLAETVWANPNRPVVPVVISGSPVPAFLRDRVPIRVDGTADWTRIATRVTSSLTEQPAPGVLRESEAHARDEQAQRLHEIADEAAKLTPGERDLERRATELERELERAQARRASSRQRAELEVKLADTLKALSRRADSIVHLERAAELLESVRKRSSESGRIEAERKLARVHLNIASLLEEDPKRIVEAVRHLDAALEIYKRLNGTESLLLGITLAQRAKVRKMAGDVVGAEDDLDASLASLGAWLYATAASALEAVYTLVTALLSRWLTGGDNSGKGGGAP